ncbi:ABC transporter ATP-binding protein, partial [Treponema pallidum]
MNDPILSVEQVSKSFCCATERIQILSDVSFSVPRAVKVAITGESGCGKSTLLNIIGGMEHADSGIVRVLSCDVLTLHEHALTEYRRQFLGLVFQFHHLLRDFTALENVMLPGLIAGKSYREVRARAYELLEKVRVVQRAHHFPAQMSGGERQRTAVARALINDPTLILADEPTGN